MEDILKYKPIYCYFPEYIEMHFKFKRQKQKYLKSKYKDYSTNNED